MIQSCKNWQKKLKKKYTHCFRTSITYKSIYQRTHVGRMKLNTPFKYSVAIIYCVDFFDIFRTHLYGSVFPRNSCAHLGALKVYVHTIYASILAERKNTMLRAVARAHLRRLWALLYIYPYSRRGWHPTDETSENGARKGNEEANEA